MITEHNKMVFVFLWSMIEFAWAINSIVNNSTANPFTYVVAGINIGFAIMLFIYSVGRVEGWDDE